MKSRRTWLGALRAHGRAATTTTTAAREGLRDQIVGFGKRTATHFKVAGMLMLSSGVLSPRGHHSRALRCLLGIALRVSSVLNSPNDSNGGTE